MKTQTKLLIVLFTLIGFAGISRAQTVEEVADVANQNSKKTLGLEQRVTILEARPAVDPTLDGRVTSNEAAVVNHGGRIAALESNPGGVDQASHDALSSRVTALESAVPETPLGWSLYDQSGAHLGHWTQREQVGRLLVNVGAYSIWAQLDRDRSSYLGIEEPVAILFKDRISGVCVDPYVVAEDYLPLVQNSTSFFGGQVHGWLNNQRSPDPYTNMNLFIVDTSQRLLYTDSAVWHLDAKKSCVTSGQQIQAEIHPLVDHGPLPTFNHPLSLVQE